MTNADRFAAPAGGPRCPQCRALVPAGSAWCMLCHADLRSDEERAAARAAAAAVAAATASAPVTDSSGGRGRHRRSASPQAATTGVVTPADTLTDTLTDTSAEAAPRVASLEDVDVDAMLEQLAAEQPDRLGSVSGQLSDRTTKIVLVLGGAGVMTLLSLLGLAVLGSLFG